MHFMLPGKWTSNQRTADGVLSQFVCPGLILITLSYQGRDTVLPRCLSAKSNSACGFVCIQFSTNIPNGNAVCCLVVAVIVWQGFAKRFSFEFTLTQYTFFYQVYAVNLNAHASQLHACICICRKAKSCVVAAEIIIRYTHRNLIDRTAPLPFSNATNNECALSNRRFSGKCKAARISRKSACGSECAGVT